MLSKSAEKLLRKLRSRKYRWQYKMFVAEGQKVVSELLRDGLQPEYLFSTDPEMLKPYGYPFELIEEKELQSISQLETANTLLGIFRFPELKEESSEGVVVGDRIQDPGNLGTIIRTCDWFGVHTLFLTKGSADIFNSKCIQSTMGSITRVKVVYDSEENIAKYIQERKVWVADMNGQDLFAREKKAENWALIMGSESHGPSDFWKASGHTLTIPKKGNSPVESLNVAQATGIILSHLSS
ncbi:MAG: RNA methyltransferase [Owenweeksia sp.]|nr:RNA methyltransferase [Owenweeksia sp.]MBF98875.1 RNA methyltransferase [Owenweeksia sp.]HBF18653.1 RNA methyltransferase [Cryomorphaceae bacterium]HCQ15233.1 RNA methyltransferase [Cryomorphaceae bacterium]|tara:strand:+ start:223 stop:942 length:720 start_codon:yes stop_codon:yes gene_type:complete